VAKIKAVVVDDELLAVKRIEQLLKDHPEFEIISSFTEADEAISKIDSLDPDVLFLDVDLGYMSGFDILKKIKVTPLVIFVTAYDKHAITAFDHFAFDFLLKPYKDERFNKCINRVVQLHLNDSNVGYEKRLKELIEHISQPKKEDTYHSGKIMVKLGNKIQLIPTKEIMYIRASGYYSEIFTKNKKHVLRESLANLSKHLEPYSFSRIHRSTIVNFDYIQELINSNYGELDVKMSTNILLRVSKSYKKAFLKKLGVQ
jgi:two-component system LytT family response regulator